jgi:hypothetical protein
MTPEEERIKQFLAESRTMASEVYGTQNNETVMFCAVRILCLKCLELETEIENLRSQVLP